MNKSFKIEKKTKINIAKLNALLLILLSFFYLQGNAELATIIITIPLLIEVLLLLGGIHQVIATKSVFIGIAIVVYTILTQLLMLDNEECLSFLFSISYFILAFISINYLSKEEILKYSKLFFVFCSILLIVDTYWRFSHPLQADFYVGIYTFYKYKGQGFFFADTNNTGMLCLAILGFMLYLSNVHGIQYKKMRLLYAVLLILTFSRAAILAYGFAIIFLNKRTPKFLKTLTIFGALIAVYFYSQSLINDPSTNAKIVMAMRAFSYWNKTELSEILFGVGFTNSIEKLGLFTHSWPITFSFEFGLVGFFLILFFWYFMYKESNKNAQYVLIPCLFAGLSFLPLLIPYVYTLIAIIIMLEKKMEE